MVEVSEILLAIWNGRQAAGTGGTAEIVEYALERDRVVLWIDPETPGEPARHIRAVEYSTNSADTAATITADEFPHTLRELSPGYGQQLSYFADPVLAPGDYADELRRTQEHLAAAGRHAGLPAKALEGIVGAALA